MSRERLAWILLAGLGLAWFVSSRADAPPHDTPAATPAERTYSESEVAAMRRQLQDLQQLSPGASASVDPGADPTMPATPWGGAAPFQDAERRAAWGRARAWSKALEATDPPGAAARARAEVLAALDSADSADVLAALVTIRWMDHAETDRAAWRARIEPHLAHEDPMFARAALEAASTVDPQDEDVDRWITLAVSEDASQTGELTAEFLLRAAKGRVEGAVADAVLHLLRPGASTKAAFVMRGLQSFRVLDGRVQARLLQIATEAKPADDDAHYYFHFLAPRIEPKSDELVDLVLERIAAGDGGASTMLRSLRRGLSAEQRARVSSQLVDHVLVEGHDGRRAELLHALVEFALPGEAARLDELAAREELNEPTRQLVRKAADAARAR